jgi:hypothetical protein
MAKLDNYVRNYRNVMVKLSDGSNIKGQINIGDRFHRLSDLFKHAQESFFVVVSEESTENSKKTYIINKNYIVWAKVED